MHLDDLTPIIDPGFTDPGFGGTPPEFGGFFALILLVAVGGVIFSAVVGMRKYRVLKDAGVDPFTVDAAVAAKVINSDILRPAQPSAPPAPERTVEERLVELDSLHARGVISDDERRTARAAILGG